MSIAIQNILVAIIALAAVAVIARRVFMAPRRSGGKPGCPSCASGDQPCAPSEPPAAGPNIHPLTLVRSKSREHS